MAFDFIDTEKFAEVDTLRARQAADVDPARAAEHAGDPRPGLEARVHDPLWLLGRQWQLGEFEGEDAGTPLTVRVVTRHGARSTAGRAGDRGGAAQPLGGARPARAARRARAAPTARRRACARAPRSGAALLAALDDAGLRAAHRAALSSTTCPLDLDPLAPPRRRARRARSGVGPPGRGCSAVAGLADGELVCRGVRRGRPRPAAWLVPADAGRTRPCCSA